MAPHGLLLRVLAIALSIAATPAGDMQRAEMMPGDAPTRTRQVHRITPPGKPRQALNRPPPEASERTRQIHAGYDADARRTALEYTRARERWLQDSSVVIQVLAFVDSSKDFGKGALDAVAQEEAGRALVVFVPCEKPEMAPLLARFGVMTCDDAPTAVLVLQPDKALGHAMRVYKQPTDDDARWDAGAADAGVAEPGGLQWETPGGGSGGGRAKVVAAKVPTSAFTIVRPGSDPEPPTPPDDAAGAVEACAPGERRITAHSLHALIAGARAGTLRRYFRSEPVLDAHTATSAATGIVTVVGESFDQLVTNQARDVLLIAHEPTCPICQRLLGELPAFAQQVQELAPSLLFATIDVTKNEVDAAVFEAAEVFPCIALFVWDAARKTHDVVPFPWSESLSPDMLSLSKYMPGFLKRHASEWHIGV